MNNDELTDKSGKVKIMYVRRDEDDAQNARGGRKSGGRGMRDAGRYASRDESPYSNSGGRNKSDGNSSRRNQDDRNKDYRNKDGRNSRRRDGSDRAGSRTWHADRDDGRMASDNRWRDGQDAPRNQGYRAHRSPAGDRDDEPQDGAFSWSTSSRLAQLTAGQDADSCVEAGFDHGGISGKSEIDPDILRRQRAEETRIYGENACQALFAHRPDAIVRGWFAEDVTPRFRHALRWLAANRKAYHVVDEEELLKVSGTSHHGGVCFLIKKRTGVTVAEWLQEDRQPQCVLALENVANPHNLGAIMRSCAHFGVRGLLVDNAALLESGAAVRTAEGGAEHVQAITSDDFIAALKQFRKAGYRIVATSSHKGASLFKTSLPEKMVLLLGQERDGISAAALALADMRIAISGTGQVESLNVSVAAGVLLSEWWRQQAR